jgi:hypothetical protein
MDVGPSFRGADAEAQAPDAVLIHGFEAWHFQARLGVLQKQARLSVVRHSFCVESLSWSIAHGTCGATIRGIAPEGGNGNVVSPKTAQRRGGSQVMGTSPCLPI